MVFGERVDTGILGISACLALPRTCFEERFLCSQMICTNKTVEKTVFIGNVSIKN